MDHSSLIRALAFVLGVLLLGVVAWGAFESVENAKIHLQAVDDVKTLDSDVTLAETIDSLEANWNRRVNYHFNVRQDPLFLGRVITGFTYAKQGFRELNEGSSLRLTATVMVIGDLPMAIIKYMGKSYVLRVGDKFGKNYEVKEIQKKKVVLSRNGQKVILRNKPLGLPRGDYSQQGTYYYSH